MAKGCISWVDEDGNETFIEHRCAVELGGGFYVVEDFKRVKRSEKVVKKLLDAGKTVHYLNAYSASSDPWDEEGYDLLFTGKIVWKNEKLDEISNLAGGGMKLGKIPAGTLVIGINDDLVQLGLPLRYTRTMATKKTKKPAPQPTDTEVALHMQLAEVTEDELTADDMETASNAENFLCELMRAFYGRPDIYKVLETAANLCGNIRARGEELDLV